MSRVASAARRGRRAVARSAARVRRHSASLLLSSAAAGLAFLIATTVRGTDDAFFAPIAAVVCVGITAGERVQRAAAIIGGVALGLTFADLLVNLVGPGWWQLGIAVLAATVAAMALRADQLMSNQAAVAAILVVALAGQDVTPWLRLIDALIGGGVALAINSVAAAVAPDRGLIATRQADEVLRGLIEVVDDVAAALSEGDLHRAEDALVHTEAVVRRVGHLDDALAAARERARLGHRTRALEHRSEPLLLVRSRIDLMVASTRALARAAANAVRHDGPVDGGLAGAVECLARALAGLCDWVDGNGERDDVREQALAAAAAASELLGTGRPRTADVVAIQIRSAVVDLLRATGLDQRDAVAELERVAGRADRGGDSA